MNEYVYTRTSRRSKFLADSRNGRLLHTQNARLGSSNRALERCNLAQRRIELLAVVRGFRRRLSDESLRCALRGNLRERGGGGSGVGAAGGCCHGRSLLGCRDGCGALRASQAAEAGEEDEGELHCYDVEDNSIKRMWCSWSESQR